MKRWIPVALCVLCTVYVDGVRTSAAPQAANADASTLSDFKKRVDAYMTLHKAAEEKVGALDPTKSPKEIADRETALGQALRAARANAKQGDVLTPAVARIFRRIIRTEFAHRSRLALKNREEAQDELPAFTPTVNQIYPTTYPLATFPPALLRELPELPNPIEYRLVRQYLILRDGEANLIVDVLPNAAPPMSALTGAGRK
jgi:hypothetical protein